MPRLMELMHCTALSTAPAASLRAASMSMGWRTQPAAYTPVRRVS
jgi:hypothetical protein